MENRIKLFLVDDHKIMLQAMESLLVSYEDIELVGTAETGEEAINQLEAAQPDIILMDIVLRHMTGIEACRWIKERNPDVKIILLSMEVTKEHLTAGIQSGISGYLPKNIDQHVLIDAIRTVKRGEKYFTDALTKLVFEDFIRNENSRPAIKKTKLPGQLTKREYEILALIASGKNNKEIADRLFISIKTAETHKTNILSKLGLKNTAELVKYSIKNKIITI